MKILNAALVVVLIGARVDAQPSRSGVFVRLRGTDTISIERYTRNADSLVGEFTQGRQLIRYTVALRPDQWVQRLDFTTGGNRVQGGHLQIDSKRIQGERKKFDGLGSVDVATASWAMPVFVPAMALLEQAIRVTGLANLTEARVPIVRPAAPGIAIDTLVLRRIATDSVLAELTEGDLRLAIGKDGSILGGSGFAPGETIVRGVAPTTWPPATNPQAGLRQAAIVSPEVHDDRTVTLRVLAPRARLVTVNGLGEFVFDRRLTKDSNGVWSITLGPLAPEVYAYQFAIDGVTLPDPLNISATSGRQSLVEIPGTVMPWSVRDVPHGTVSTVWYHSKSLGGAFRAMAVYTPPGYERSTDSLPVLYSLGGAGSTESSTFEARANFILDNLLADRRAKPMIVVSVFLEPRPATKLGIFSSAPKTSGSVSNDLLEDVIPLIEQRYRVGRSADMRAIVGGSNGGPFALFDLGLKHLDLFHWIGGFAASFGPASAEQLVNTLDAAAVNRQVKLLWTASSRDDPIFAPNEAFATALDARGVKHTFVVTTGFHVSSGRSFVEFAQLLFR